MLQPTQPQITQHVLQAGAHALDAWEHCTAAAAAAAVSVA
jgi:hypothetical protein